MNMPSIKKINGEDYILKKRYKTASEAKRFINKGEVRVKNALYRSFKRINLKILKEKLNEIYVLYWDDEITDENRSQVKKLGVSSDELFYFMTRYQISVYHMSHAMCVDPRTVKNILNKNGRVGLSINNCLELYENIDPLFESILKFFRKDRQKYKILLKNKGIRITDFIEDLEDMGDIGYFRDRGEPDLKEIINALELMLRVQNSS